MLIWYVNNAIARYANTDQAVVFLRPMFDACIVGTQLAGRIAGRYLSRLKALKDHTNHLSSANALTVIPKSRDEAIRVVGQWCERKLGDKVLIHDQYFAPNELSWLQLIRSANPMAQITVLTSRRHQPTVPIGGELQDLYVEAWRRLYDQAPPKTEIAIIGGEISKESPIHDRWLVSGDAGLRFGTSFNSLGVSKKAEISEMSLADVDQNRATMEQYLKREKTEHNGEKLRLSVFWL